MKKNEKQINNLENIFSYSILGAHSDAEGIIVVLMVVVVVVTVAMVVAFVVVEVIRV